jgi:energy-coupling factor transporter ATP-binding protein EcfA2
VSEAPALRVARLSKRFGDVEALRDLDLEVAPGEVMGYLGPNGAGKTTTIRLILGMLHPTAGHAEILSRSSVGACTRRSRAGKRCSSPRTCSLDHLLARPVARTTWLLGRVGAAFGLMSVCALLAACAAWLPAATQHSDVGIVLMLQAGVNAVPIAAFVLGVGVLMFGVSARAGSGAWYGLIDLIGD